MSDAGRHLVTVDDSIAGQRLDRVLAARTALSRTRLKALILDGAVAIGPRTIRDPGYRVNAGEIVAIDVPPPEPAPELPVEEPATEPAPTPKETPVAGDATPKERTMPEQDPAESFRADMNLTPPPAAPAPPEPSERDLGAQAEHERVEGIRRACLNARVSRAFEDRLISENVPLSDARGQVLEEVAKRDVDVPGRTSRPPTGHEVQVGDDPFVHVRAGIEEALKDYMEKRKRGAAAAS